MPSPHSTSALTPQYTTAIEAICEVARTSLFLGQLENAQHVLRTALRLQETGEVAPQDQFKLLLWYGKVLNVAHLIHQGEPEILLATVQQARHLAETTQDQQNLADALSLLGQVHCNATTVALLKRGALPFGSQERGYTEALAFHQEALQLQETLQETRGMSESLFGIGLIHQFWQQHDQARACFHQALQVAEQHEHLLEQAEPHRHLTMDALFQGELDQALFHAQQALSFREAGGFKPYQPFDHLSLRDIFLKRGETTQAEWHLQQAAALAEEMGFASLVSSLLETSNRLGDLQMPAEE